MASREVVDVSSSDDEFKEPPRKPIGWNYQLGTSKDVKTKSRANGAAAATALAAPASASHNSAEDSDDDLEIIEVKVEPQTKKASLPPSCSRAEIRRQIRNTTQSSISNFFNQSPKAEKGSNKESKVKDEKKVKKTTANTSEKDNSKKGEEGLKKEEVKGYEEEEEDDKSPATMEAFMSRWEEIKPLGKDDQKIRDKLWKYYHLAHTSYTHSKKFIQIVETSIHKLSIDNTYVVIKDILDCLKRYKDTPYREKLSGEESAGTSREGTPAPIEVEDTKTNKKLRKVDNMMKEIAVKIKALESQEVDLDDEVNSTYLVEERLKRQFTKLHSYYCRLANCSPATGRPTERKFKFRGSRWQEINKRVTAWVNKHKEFPDYTDILNLVKKVTKQSSLPLRPETVRVQAQEIFRDVGKMLKYRRESDDLYSIYSYVDEDGEDPAKEDEELNNRLNENEKLAQEKLNKIFQEYVDKDAQQREEADKATEKDKTSKSPVKQESNSQDPSGAAEGQEGESSKVDGKERDEDLAAARETQVVAKNDADTCRQSDRTASIKNEEEEEEEEEEEDSVDDIAQDTGGEDEEDTSDEDDDTVDEEEEEEQEEESEATKEQTSSGAKKEELDEADETDDELKNVLASACRDEEEEEDSEEDIPVLDSEELLGLEEFRTTNHEEINSIVCLDDESKMNGPSTATPGEGKGDYPSDVTATPTVLHNNENDSSIPTCNKSPPLAASNAHSSPSSTTVADMAKPHQKRQLEDESSPACKKLCLESPKS